MEQQTAQGVVRTLALPSLQLHQLDKIGIVRCLLNGIALLLLFLQKKVLKIVLIALVRHKFQRPFLSDIECMTRLQIKSKQYSTVPGSKKHR